MRRVIVLLLLMLAGCGSRPVWQWPLESRSYGDPVIEGDRVYVVSESGEVIAGEYRTGKQLWEVKASGPVLAAPAVDQRNVYAVTQDGDVYALEKNSGTQVWRVQVKERFGAPLTVTEDLLLLPSLGGILYALSPADGTVLWERGNHRKIISAAVVANNYIFYGGFDDKVYCIRKDGSESWSFKTDHVIVESALVYKNIVIFTSHDDYVYAFDIPSGKLLWRFAAKDSTNMVMIQGELVFGELGDSLFCLQPETGKLLRKIQVKKLPERIYERSGKCLMVSRHLYEIDTHTGRIRKLHSLREGVFKAAIAPGFLVLTDELFSVYGFSD